MDFAKLLDCVDDALLVISRDLKMLYANASLRSIMFGAADAQDRDISEMAISDFIHPDDLAHVSAAFYDLVDHNRHQATAKLRILDHASWRPVEVTMTDRSDDSDVLGVVAYFRNLSKEEHFRSLLQTQIALAGHNRVLQLQLEERQRFLSRLVGIQTRISRRGPTEDVLAAVAEGARSLLGDPIVALMMADPAHPERLFLAAHLGFDVTSGTFINGVEPTEVGTGGRAFEGNQLVVDTNVLAWENRTMANRADITAAIAVPIRDGGAAIGCLTIASTIPGRSFSLTEREMLLSFAEHASLVIKDATATEAIRAALTDPLSGLPNRRVLIERLNRCIEDSREDGGTFAVLFIDLDRFKIINDVRGHAAGDQALRTVAQRISSQIRAADLASRSGGDEFIVVLEGATAPVAATIAERILDALNEPIWLDGQQVAVSATIGVTLNDDPTLDAEALVRRADLAMYHGKSAGRNRVEFFEPYMEHSTAVRAEMENHFRQAIYDGLLDVVFQPIVDIDSRAVIGVEALARWWSDEHGRVAADRFISLARGMALLAELDRSILRRACRSLVDLTDDHGKPLRLHVNVSRQLLETPEVDIALAAILESCRFDPSRLTLEITETDSLQDPHGVARVLAKIKRLGISIAVDDFGTSTSTLTYLERFPVDMIKIHGTFTAGMDDQRTRIVTESMIHMATGLGVTTVMEGVESEPQALLAAALHADALQGYHISPPLDRAALTSWLDAAAAATSAPAS